MPYCSKFAIKLKLLLRYGYSNFAISFYAAGHQLQDLLQMYHFKYAFLERRGFIAEKMQIKGRNVKEKIVFIPFLGKLLYFFLLFCSDHTLDYYLT